MTAHPTMPSPAVAPQPAAMLRLGLHVLASTIERDRHLAEARGGFVHPTAAVRAAAMQVHSVLDIYYRESDSAYLQDLREQTRVLARETSVCAHNQGGMLLSTLPCSLRAHAFRPGTWDPGAGELASSTSPGRAGRLLPRRRAPGALRRTRVDAPVVAQGTTEPHLGRV